MHTTEDCLHCHQGRPVSHSAGTGNNKLIFSRFHGQCAPAVNSCRCLHRHTASQHPDAAHSAAAVLPRETSSCRIHVHLMAAADRPPGYEGPVSNPPFYADGDREGRN